MIIRLFAIKHSQTLHKLHFHSLSSLETFQSFSSVDVGIFPQCLTHQMMPRALSTNIFIRSCIPQILICRFCNLLMQSQNMLGINFSIFIWKFLPIAHRCTLLIVAMHVVCFSLTQFFFTNSNTGVMASSNLVAVGFCPIESAFLI